MKYRQKYAKEGIKAVWINHKGTAALASSITGWFSDIMYEHFQLHATPVDVRRMTISQALSDELMGKKSPLEVDRLLSLLNTSRATAREYYDIKNKGEVRNQAKEFRMSLFRPKNGQRTAKKQPHEITNFI